MFYPSRKNAAEAVRVYGRNHKLKRGPWFVKSVHNSVKKNWGNGILVIDRDPNNPVLLLKLLSKCIIRWLQVHFIQQKVFPAVWMYRKPQFSKFSALFCRCFIIDSSESRLWNLEKTNRVSTLRIYSSSDMMKIAGGRCWHYGRMRHISLSLGT